MRWADFTTLSRQVTLEEPTREPEKIYQHARQLLEVTWPPGQAVRLLGVGVSGLGRPIRQLRLWEAGEEPSETQEAPAETQREQRLRAAVEELRLHFGENALRWGSDLEAEPPNS